MTRLNFLKEYCTVPYAYMDKEPFNKYFMHIDDIGVWAENKILSEMTDEEFYTMVTTCIYESATLYKEIIDNTNIKWWRLPT